MGDITRSRSLTSYHVSLIGGISPLQHCVHISEKLKFGASKDTQRTGWLTIAVTGPGYRADNVSRLRAFAGGYRY